MQLTLISTRSYLLDFLNRFLKNNNLIFFNTGVSQGKNLDYGTTIDLNAYLTGTLHIKIGTKESYDNNIKPNLMGSSIYREMQYDFISVVQIELPNKIIGALITGEPSRSDVVRKNIQMLKKYLKEFFNVGMKAKESGFDEYNKSFSKYYWEKGIEEKDNLYDWQGGNIKLQPINNAEETK